MLKHLKLNGFVAATHSPFMVQDGRASRINPSACASGGGNDFGSSPGKAAARMRVRTAPGLNLLLDMQEQSLLPAELSRSRLQLDAVAFILLRRPISHRRSRAKLTIPSDPVAFCDDDGRPTTTGV
jgi:hypothetical protein